MDEALHETFLRLARAFDRRPPREPRRPSRSSTAGAAEPGSRPGDKYCGPQGPDWHEVLTPAGWTPVRQVGDKVLWRRPGKDRGWSATTGFCRSGLRGDLLYVFSSNAAPFEPETSYSKFEAYAQLHHQGDYATAAQELAQDERYGESAQPFRVRGLDGPRLDSVPVPIPIAGTESSSPNGSILVDTKDSVPAIGMGTGTELKSDWPPPVPASLWQRQEANAKWLWHGYLSRGGITLLSAYWKAGKTTLLAHLLRAMETGGLFCSLAVKPARVLIVSEEDQGTWAERRDELSLHDHLELIARPFRMRPTLPEWRSFLFYLAGLITARAFDFVAFDTISKLWPVRDENDAPTVENALMPLYSLTDKGASVLLMHHFRKSDGLEATGSRGSGSLPAFVETIIEFRRYEAASLTNTRRVLSAYGRFPETPRELVLDLQDGGFTSLGDRSSVQDEGVLLKIQAVLGPTEPGKTTAQVVEETGVQRRLVLAALAKGELAGMWIKTGTGKRSSPHLWRLTESPDEPILLFLRRNGPSTAVQAALALGRPADDVRRQLERLVTQGVLGADESGEPVRYYLLGEGG